MGERSQQIQQSIHLFPCMDGWTPQRLLGEGTVGSVFYICRNADSTQCAAAKVQIVTTPDELRGFHEEVRIQQAFYPYAPQVIAQCTVRIASVTYAVIIMELIARELDKFLSVRRTPAELLKVFADMSYAFEFMQQRRYTHGDLALFNIGWSDASERWVLLDFDRASTEVYSPSTDFYRIQMELYKCTNQSDVDVCNMNMTWLRKNALPKWSELFHLMPMRTAQEAQDKWIDEYQLYCRRANIKCLDSNIWNV